MLKNQVVDVTNWSTSYTRAAGSMVSTLGDLKNWGRDLTGGALLDHRLQRKRLNFISTGQGYEYGLGIFRLGNFCGHNGLIYGYDSTMLHSPRFHATIVILANASPQLNNPALTNPYPPPPAVPNTPNLSVVLAPIAFPNMPPVGSAAPSC